MYNAYIVTYCICKVYTISSRQYILYVITGGTHRYRENIPAPHTYMS